MCLPCLLTGDINYVNVCPGCVSKPSDGKSPVLEVWVMWSTSSLPLVPGYKKIMSYPLDSCVPRCGEAEGKRPPPS